MTSVSGIIISCLFFLIEVILALEAIEYEVKELINWNPFGQLFIKIKELDDEKITHRTFIRNLAVGTMTIG